MSSSQVEVLSNESRSDAELSFNDGVITTRCLSSECFRCSRCLHHCPGTIKPFERPRCRADNTPAMQSFTVQPLLVDPFLQRDLLDFGNAAPQHSSGDSKVSISCAVGYSEC
jgi:hypothetical protein